jgi:formiminotetrahydrofolate cyclodeaminase
VSTSSTVSAELSAREFNRRVADPERFSGGGSVAALVGAQACAVALLVGRLSARRRANAALRPALEAANARLSAVEEQFFRAADHDLAILDQLLEAQRGLRGGGARAAYVEALEAAARSPLELAAQCVEVLELIAAQTPAASRFTISDLGAAAALANGACRAACLTALVNVALLREETPPAASAAALAAREQELRQLAAQLTAAIEAQVSATIAGRAERER